MFCVQVGGLAGRVEAGCQLAGCGERLLLLLGDTMLCLEGQIYLNTIFYHKPSIYSTANTQALALNLTTRAGRAR